MSPFHVVEQLWDLFHWTMLKSHLFRFLIFLSLNSNIMVEIITPASVVAVLG